MTLDRRRFLARTAGTSASLAFLHGLPTLRSAPAAPLDDPVPCALIGCGGRGTYLLDLALKSGSARFLAVCDVSRDNAGRAAKLVDQAAGQAPRVEADFRRVLEDPAIEALIVAVPHHWHTPLALRALAAGKHIYLEKPASHVFSEGRVLVEAAKKSGRILQHGTQMRSSPVTLEAGKVIASGVLGRIVETHAFGVEPRGAFPKPVPDSDPPAGLDWDTWLGPAPAHAYNALRHSNWNNYPEYGNGEIGGDGIHDIDMARWGLGVTEHPVAIMAQGSRVAVEGESAYPDNMTVVYQYADGRKLLYENRNFAPYGQYGHDNANVFYGTEGYMVFSRRGYFQAYLGAKEEKGPGAKGGQGPEEHMANYFRSVRQGSPSVADAEVAHLSCALVHLGEVAYRTGRVLHFDPKAEAIAGDDQAAALLTKSYRAPWPLQPRAS